MSVEQVAEISTDRKRCNRRLPNRRNAHHFASFVSYYKKGYTPQDFVDDFPTLSLEVVYLAIGQYLRHQREFDAYLEKVHAYGAQLREKARPGHEALRIKLNSRKKN